MRIHLGAAAVALVAIAGAALPASANAVFSLNFEGIAPYPNSNNVAIQEFYNGGGSSIGSSGPDLGVSFTSSALLLCLNSTSITCSSTSRGDTPDSAGSREGALFYQFSNETGLNIGAGFTTGFAFNYVARVPGVSVTIFAGLNGMGIELASLDLSPNAVECPAFDAFFCPFSPAGVTFSGTARSVVFAGGRGAVAFDDLTFGSDRPVGGGDVEVPAPAALALFGIGLLGFAAARGRCG